MNNLKISAGTQVSLHFALLLEDGETVDSTFEKEPARLTIGDGNLPEGFEACIHGLVAGDQKTFTVLPEKAFGQHNPSNVQQLARASFANIDELEEGMIIGFADKAGGELPGVITEINERQVEVDFNHPLAGRTLTFKVEILDVNPVTLQ
ncbi:MAG: FKBP-type peptidyl-prolyl cis-trans isomerase [Pseudomonadaceae bacterium]|nr:FKBP-type peptidyl-prolyl cis-trans isomerase [Pseudomonadaceae bacterium]